MGCSRCQRRAVRCQPSSWTLTAPSGDSAVTAGGAAQEELVFDGDAIVLE